MRQETKQNKKCALCGNFLPAKKHKFCSKECFDKNRNEYYRKKGREKYHEEKQRHRAYIKARDWGYNADFFLKDNYTEEEDEKLKIWVQEQKDKKKSAANAKKQFKGKAYAKRYADETVRLGYCKNTNCGLSLTSKFAGTPSNGYCEECANM